MSITDLIGQNTGTSERRIAGVVIGIVTNNKDPDGMGRVKLKFPWRDDSDESHWARVAALMAGNERGAFFLPEVDDEVLVAFDHGDISHPYVVGALWNGVDKPPETNADGKNNIRKIKSRSGHEIILCDDGDSGKEKVEIHTAGGHKILLDDSKGGEKIEIVDKSGSNSIRIDSVQNSVAIESSMNLKIKGQQVEIEAGGMMTVKAGATLTLQGAMVKIN
ncbi:Phage-related baseplate assembly protein [Pelotomaculum sp. FP]|uniref:phage baseplate assembly protein V n=1 Tax=Pelotomaculum sp. FP TaxID=261474 RepID=UPI0010669ED3|nr:phage baseplate assembly protein V [Pelotomaculum sp. FP]TEB15323.1 Phage-related baseplate assembly protein [Pelotomaculum sp. FP]